MRALHSPIAAYTDRLPHVVLAPEAKAFPHPEGAPIFRASRARLLVALLAVDSLAVGLTAAILLGVLPSFAWLAVGIALLISPLIGFSFVRSMSRANWLLRVDPTAAMVKFRSFQRDAGPGATTICIVPWNAIESVASVTETFVRDRGTSRERWTETSLQFTLLPGAGDDLFLAIHEDRSDNAFAEDGSRRKSVVQHYPVRMPNATRLRLKFAGRQDAINPGVDQALAALADHTQVGDPIEIDFSEPNEIPFEEFNEAVLSLAESGQLLSATSILRARTGCSLTEARETVRDLIGQSNGARVINPDTLAA